MPVFLVWPLGCLLSFLVGGTPTALLVVRAIKGVDVRQVGSGNVGATNASRAFSGRGARTGVFLGIYLIDFAKGFVPVSVLAPLLAPGPGLAMAVGMGIAAILGHCFSPWLGGRGGKGVATTCGVFAALEPLALVVSLFVFFVVRVLTGAVYWGSLALGLALAVVTIARDPESAFGARLATTLFAVLVAAFLVWTHRSNLRGFMAARRGEAATS